MTTVYMICGYLGAGKTTFARSLEERERALRFSVDEIYLRLFAQGPTHELDADAMGRVRAVIEDQWTRAVSLKMSVVLDLGFWDKELRVSTRKRAEELGAAVRLYHLECPDEVARERCLSRNSAEGAFLISEEGYQELKVKFTPPGEDESPIVIDTAAESVRPAPVSKNSGPDVVTIEAYDDGRDRADVVALWKDVFVGDPSYNDPEAMIDQKLRFLPELFLVARLHDRTVGTVVGGYDGVRGWMHHLTTSVFHRRDGVARKLVEDLERRLLELGCVKLNLQVRKGNEEVIGFYELLGYAVEERESLGKRLVRFRG